MYEEKIRPYLNDIVKLRAKKLTTKEIASHLGIEEHDLTLAIQEKDELYNAWYKGESYLIELLENALYRAAMGHMVEEEEIIETTNFKGQKSTITKVKKKFVQSVPAAIRALEVVHNRRWTNIDKVSNEIEIILPKELLEYSE